LRLDVVSEHQPSFLPAKESSMAHDVRATSPFPAALGTLDDELLHDLVKLAFFWGMHPAGSYQLRYVYTQLESHRNFVGLNRIKWDRAPRGAADRSATTPNATTLYGFGMYDLRREPIVIATPAVADRYFSVQASDQYPRWYFQVGKQFTGSGAQRYLIVGPDFRGPYPADFAAAHVWSATSNHARRNWLPAPDGPRFFGPKGSLIDWTYDMPVVVRVD